MKHVVDAFSRSEGVGFLARVTPPFQHFPPWSGVVQGGHLGLEIDVSILVDVQRCVLRRHFGVFMRCITHCLRVVYFPDLAQPRGGGAGRGRLGRDGAGAPGQSLQPRDNSRTDQGPNKAPKSHRCQTP